jgi:hypothetical protein
LTLGAEAGMNTTELKRMSGHKSDNVMEGYIANTEWSKTHQSNILSGDSPVRQPNVKKTRRSPGGFFEGDTSASSSSSFSTTCSGTMMQFNNCTFTEPGVLTSLFAQIETKK